MEGMAEELKRWVKRSSEYKRLYEYKDAYQCERQGYGQLPTYEAAAICYLGMRRRW